jgi:hypothetical protein
LSEQACSNYSQISFWINLVRIGLRVTFKLPVWGERQAIEAVGGSFAALELWAGFAALEFYVQ